MSWDFKREYLRYEHVIRVYAGVINDKADRGDMSEDKAARLLDKLNEWFTQNTVRLGEEAKHGSK